MSSPRVTVVVVVHAGAERLDDAVASLEGYEGDPAVEVVLVDNASPDRCGEVARKRWPWLRAVRSDVNVGFAGGVALGVEAASGDVLVLLNDDAAAGEGFVEAHLAALDATPDAAASAGRLTSWDGRRHDFVRGILTFDAHAFQAGQGADVDEVAPPEAGEPLPFACGGNMAVRRRDWVLSGGFDPSLFAYFEDVELGWRLLSAGRDIVACPAAVARHRGAATSAAFGDFRRGVLYERNALRTFFACADEEHRQAVGPAVLATFLHRMVAFARAEPARAAWASDPFAPDLHPPLDRGERWRRRLRRQGVVRSLRHGIARLLLGPSVGHPRLGDDHLLMQIRAADGFFRGLDEASERRRSLEDRRRVSDRELLRRFPRLVVPTYAGDEAWFESTGFSDLFPDGWGFERRRLDEVMRLEAVR